MSRKICENYVFEHETGVNDIKALSSKYISSLIKNKITFDFPLSVTEKDRIIFIDTTNCRKILLS